MSITFFTSLLFTSCFSLIKLSCLIPTLFKLFFINFNDSLIDKAVNSFDIFSKFLKSNFLLELTIFLQYQLNSLLDINPHYFLEIFSLYKISLILK